MNESNEFLAALKSGDSGERFSTPTTDDDLVVGVKRISTSSTQNLSRGHSRVLQSSTIESSGGLAGSNLFEVEHTRVKRMQRRGTFPEFDPIDL